MPKITNPHFALPFRYHNNNPVCVEQDTPDDIAVCVEAILRTPPGQRVYNPTFGVSDITFSQRPVDVDAIINRIEASEPRVRVLMEEDPSILTTRIRTIVQRKE